MIATKLIFQSLFGVVAVFGSIGGTIAVTNKSSLASLNEVHFYLVKEKTSKKQKPSSDLLNKYKCTFTKTKIKEDKDCKIYSLTFSEKKTINLKTLQEFINDNTKEHESIKETKSKSEITNDKFFLLKTTSEVVNLNGKQELELMSMNKSEKDKSFSSFNVLAKITKEKAIGEVFYMITKMEENGTEVNNNVRNSPHTCHLKSKINEKKECKVFEINKETEVKEIDFSNKDFWEQQSNISLTKNKYFVISITDYFQYSISELKEKKSIFLEFGNQKANKKQGGTEMIVVASIFVQRNSTFKVKEAVIIENQ